MRRRPSGPYVFGRKKVVAVAIGFPLLAAVVVLFVRGTLPFSDGGPSIAKMSPSAAAEAAIAPPPPTLEGLDLSKIDVRDQGATAPLPDKKIAKLAIDPGLQRAASGVMAKHHLPEAAVVMMDVETGKILVYASHVEKGPKRDLVIEASAPAASVFKVVTGTSLVENAHLLPDHKECYSGGEHRISMQDLVPDAKRDRWCATLAFAMGRSLNTVFARLALAHLEPAQLEETAKALGFGAPLPFDVPVQPSSARFPDERLGFARTAAGFWNTTLSPLHAAWLGAAIARGGEPVRPVLVTDIVSDGKVRWSAPVGLAQKRVMKVDTAKAVATMMDTTVSDGTAYRAFHDGRGRSFLPGVSVAGKTGTLTDPTSKRFYTWFTGFAPSKPLVLPSDGGKDGGERSQPRQVAFGVLVVNEPKWIIKANVLAREVLRAYFAAQRVPGVTSPRWGQEPSSSGSGTSRASQPRGREKESSTKSTTPGTKQRRQRGS